MLKSRRRRWGICAAWSQAPRYGAVRPTSTEDIMRSYVAAILVALSAALSLPAHAETVRVLAAFTFKNALDERVQAYTSDAGGQVVPQYGMTPMLAKQVENLAPDDI